MRKILIIKLLSYNHRLEQTAYSGGSGGTLCIKEVMLEDKIQQYQGKPTSYLDQNILDLFVSIGLGDFADGLKSKFRVVYSDETLKEIKRSGDYAEKFLNVLKKLDAYHLKIILEQPGFVITDKATLTSRDPFEAYEEYLKNEPEYNDVQLAMEQSLYKFSGGRVGDGISEIHDEQKEAFTALINQLSIHASELSQEIPGIEGVIKEYGEAMKTQLDVTLDEIERLMKENISDDRKIGSAPFFYRFCPLFILYNVKEH